MPATQASGMRWMARAVVVDSCVAAVRTQLSAVPVATSRGSLVLERTPSACKDHARRCRLVGGVLVLGLGGAIAGASSHSAASSSRSSYSATCSTLLDSLTAALSAAAARARLFSGRGRGRRRFALTPHLRLRRRPSARDAVREACDELGLPARRAQPLGSERLAELSDAQLGRGVQPLLQRLRRAV